VRECAPEPVIRAPAEAFLPTVHIGRTVNSPGQHLSFAADFSGAQLCATYSPSSAPATHSSDPRKGHSSVLTTEKYLRRLDTTRIFPERQSSAPSTIGTTFRVCNKPGL